jgi:hypothetical protein
MLTVSGMSSFPPKQWRVRYLEDLDSLTIEARTEDKISMEALLAVKPAQGEEGAFRFVLAGCNHLGLSIPIYDILPIPSFKDWTLVAEWEVGTQVKLSKNSCTSEWIDLVELVSSSDVDVEDKEGENVSETFLEILEEYRKTGDQPAKAGICLRWALGLVGKEDEIQLIAQVLPCTLAVLAASRALQSDFTMGMIVGCYPVEYEKFDGQKAAGPVPTLVSSDPDTALQHLKASPEYAHRCLQALVSKLLARKELSR